MRALWTASCTQCLKMEGFPMYYINVDRYDLLINFNFDKVKVAMLNLCAAGLHSIRN